MATINRYEEIVGWQKARDLTNLVYNLTRQTEFARDYGLKDQIRRAAISVMSNIAEGFGRESNQDFMRFLSISKASANEVQSQLYIALDQKYITGDQFQQGYQLCDETIRAIGGFIRYRIYSAGRILSSRNEMKAYRRVRVGLDARQSRTLRYALRSASRYSGC